MLVWRCVSESCLSPKRFTDLFKVVATIVWLAAGNEHLPVNAANPKDLITLMNWVDVSLPCGA
jgi:hypothetical protein